MPSYTALTTEWLAQTIASMHKSTDVTESTAPLLTYEDYARALLISGLELLISDQHYAQYLSSIERQDASVLKNDVSQSSFPIAALLSRIKTVLTAAKRGWWIFDIGFSNGLLYETLICLLRHLQSEQMHYLQKHYEQATRMMAGMIKKSDNRSAEIYQKTIKIKQSLVGVSDQDEITLRAPPSPSPQVDPSPADLPPPTQFPSVISSGPRP